MRPSWASAAAARASAGDEHHPEQPQARARGHKHRAELKESVGNDEREEHVEPVVLGHHRARNAKLQGRAVHEVQREEAGDAERDALQRKPRVVGPHLRRERRLE